MSEKYRVNIPKVQMPHHAKAPHHAAMQGSASGQQMNKVTDTLLDVTKVAVVGGVAMGTIAAAGTLLKK
jgi:multisubunit Na+/H+ antiporter MnhB subunit